MREGLELPNTTQINRDLSASCYQFTEVCILRVLQVLKLLM
jgi:hypothetical protein